MELGGQLHVLVSFPGTHWIGAWVGPRAGLDAAEYKEISCPSGNRTAPGARSYPGSPHRPDFLSLRR
jgi:hypothetical protein